MVLGQLWDIYYLQSQSSFVVRIRHSTLFYPRIRWQWPLKIQSFNAKRTHFEGKGFLTWTLVTCLGFVSWPWWCGNWNWNLNVIFYQQTWWWGRPPFCWICPPMSSTWNCWFKYTSNHMRSIYTKLNVCLIYFFCKKTICRKRENIF